MLGRNPAQLEQDPASRKAVRREWLKYFEQHPIADLRHYYTFLFPVLEQAAAQQWRQWQGLDEFAALFAQRKFIAERYDNTRQTGEVLARYGAQLAEHPAAAFAALLALGAQNRQDYCLSQMFGDTDTDSFPYRHAAAILKAALPQCGAAQTETLQQQVLEEFDLAENTADDIADTRPGLAKWLKRSRVVRDNIRLLAEAAPDTPAAAVLRGLIPAAQAAIEDLAHLPKLQRITGLENLNPPPPSQPNCKNAASGWQRRKNTTTQPKKTDGRKTKGRLKNGFFRRPPPLVGRAFMPDRHRHISKTSGINARPTTTRCVLAAPHALQRPSATLSPLPLAGEG